MASEPTIELDPRYGAPGVPATPWETARSLLAAAPLWWLSTVRPSGQPHVTPLVGVWCDGAPHVTTGVGEQKHRNLGADPRCAVTTGTNEWDAGTDVVVEGSAVRVVDEAALRAVAAAYLDKYGDAWRFEVRDGCFHHGGGPAHVLRVEPSVAYAFGKDPHSHTRYRF